MVPRRIRALLGLLENSYAISFGENLSRIVRRVVVDHQDFVLGRRVIELSQGLNAARKILACVVNRDNDREFDFHETPLESRFRTNGLGRPRVVSPGRNGS